MELVAAITGVCLAGTWLCSLAEAAFYSIPRSRIETLRRFKHGAAERLAELRDNVEHPISAILIANTLFTTLGAIWAGALVEARYGHVWLGVYSAGLTAALLFLSEIVPKSLGVRYADVVAPRLARPLQWLVRLLWPAVAAAVLLTRWIGRKARISHPTEEDLISTALLSEAGGKILPQEARLLRSVLRLDEIRTKDLMTPYSKMRRISEKLPLSMTKVDAGHWRFKRIPVCRDDAPDDIVGVVHRREVFRAMIDRPPDTTMHELMMPIHFVRDDLPAHQLLNHLIANKTQIACVRDAEDRLVGVVTLEDVLEDMIGAEIE